MQLFFFLHFRQLGCHNSFFFFLPFSATWFPQFIFSLSSSLQFRQLGFHKSFFLSPHPYNFGNLVATIVFSFGHSPQHALGALHGQSLGRTRILVISLQKFNFLSPLTHCTFSCNFGNTVAEIQSLSSFCQITLNNTYNTNKLHFLQYLAKRLNFFLIIV